MGEIREGVVAGARKAPATLVRLVSGAGSITGPLAVGVGALLLAAGPATFGASVPFAVALIGAGAGVGGLSYLSRKFLNTQRDAAEEKAHEASEERIARQTQSQRSKPPQEQTQAQEKLEEPPSLTPPTSDLRSSMSSYVPPGARRNPLVPPFQLAPPFQDEACGIGRSPWRSWKPHNMQEFLDGEKEKKGPDSFGDIELAENKSHIVHSENGKVALRDYGDRFELGRNLDKATMDKAIKKGLQLLQERTSDGRGECKLVHVHPPASMREDQARAFVKQVQTLAQGMGIQIVLPPNLQTPRTKEDFIAQSKSSNSSSQTRTPGYTR